MSGVGSTNAMKKGSANNPFLAFSEADMKGYLNSAYTGCIVKYTGDPIARKITFETANIPEHAQNLVFTRNAPTFGDYGFGDLVITKKQNGSTTTEYLRCACCNLLTGLIGPLSSGTPSGDNYVKFIGLFSSNINTSNRNLIRACWVPDAIDPKYEYPDWWPVTPGWQEDFVNTEGKVVEWGYGEDVVFTYSGDSDAVLLVPCVITPYEVGELYKVVYSNNEYRYEEFHCISEDKTTAGVEDVAPGKTFYDFTGTKQVGTGTRANPFLARSDSDMNAFNNATYLGKFVKYIGKTNNTYVKDAIYQVTNDATEYDRYMLLPTLENEGQPSELAEGKELISSLGAVVVGTGNIVLKAATTEGMQALFTEANVGKLVQYLGDSNVYIKDAIYQIVDTSSAKQYYELPALTSEGTADDLALGKELINSKGEKVVGTIELGDIQGKLFYGSTNYSNATNGIYISIPGLTKMPKFVLFMSNKAYGDNKNNVYSIVYPVPYNNDNKYSYYVGGLNYGTQDPVTFDENTKVLYIPTGNYRIHGVWCYYIIA